MALGRNPDRQAVEPLLACCRNDSNVMLAKAVALEAWANYRRGARLCFAVDPGPAVER